MAPRPAARASRAGRTRPLKGRIIVDEKTALRLRRLRWRRLAIGLSLAGLIGLAAAAYFSPLFRVQSVDVTGATTVDAAQLQGMADLKGQSMFRADLSKVQERIEALPQVASVKVERHWPNTVRVAVSERQPWGYWQVGNDRYLIDNEGVVLTPEAKAPANAPVVKDLTNPVRLMAGDHVDAETVELVRALLKRLPGELKLSVAAAEYSPASGLTVTTDAGYRVVLGDSQNVDYKLAVWREIESELGRGAMAGHVLDLRFGDRPSFQ